MEDSYTCLWEFEVRPERQVEFEQHYGRDGSWTRLFRQSNDFIETLLLKDISNPGRYITVDRWRSKEAYLAFRSNYANQYIQLDKTFNQLSFHENFFGEYSEQIT